MSCQSLNTQLICCSFTIKLSLFFDILLPCCTDTDKHAFVTGTYKTNVRAPANQLELIHKSRSLLWTSLRPFKMTNKSLTKSTTYNYLHNDTMLHRQHIFRVHGRPDNKPILINTILKDNAKCQIGPNTAIVNCDMEASRLKIGSNCFLNDIIWVCCNFFFKLN